MTRFGRQIAPGSQGEVSKAILLADKLAVADRVIRYREAVRSVREALRVPR
jgi:hypothetical protein